MIYDGNKTVAASGTRERLSSVHKIAAWITFQPLAANTNAVYIGGSTVSATSGLSMLVGDSAVTWPVSDINGYDLYEIWIDGATNGNGVQFIYFTR